MDFPGLHGVLHSCILFCIPLTHWGDFLSHPLCKEGMAAHHPSQPTLFVRVRIVILCVLCHFVVRSTTQSCTPWCSTEPADYPPQADPYSTVVPPPALLLAQPVVSLTLSLFAGAFSFQRQVFYEVDEVAAPVDVQGRMAIVAKMSNNPTADVVKSLWRILGSILLPCLQHKSYHPVLEVRSTDGT